MTETATTETRPEAPAEVLRATRVRRRAADGAEADLLCLAVEWAVMHPAESIHPQATHRLRSFGETDLAIAGSARADGRRVLRGRVRVGGRALDRGREASPG